MLSSKSRKSPDPPMTLKERMKFFEKAAEAERKKNAPPPRNVQRGISSSGASSASTCSNPGNKPVPAPRAGKCGRVSLSRTISGESVVREVVSPLSLPTRTTVSDLEPVYDRSSLKSKCRFGEVRRESVELLETSKTCYLATHMEPIENRIDEAMVVLPSDTKVEVLPSDTKVEVMDRDSGVSCSSDDQDQLLSDTEVYSTEMQSVDSGVFSQAQKVVIGPKEESSLPAGSQLSAIKSAGPTVAEAIRLVKEAVEPTTEETEEPVTPTKEVVQTVTDTVSLSTESLPVVTEIILPSTETAPTVTEAVSPTTERGCRSPTRPALARWSSLLEIDGEEEKEEEKEEEDEEEEDTATLGENTVESEEAEPTLDIVSIVVV